jgi:hypothetical protein
VLLNVSGHLQTESLAQTNRFSGTTQEFVGFPADIFPLGILYLYLLTALCGGSQQRLTERKRGKGQPQRFSDPLNIRWVIEHHLPTLSYERVQEFCTRGDFEAVKRLIIKMIDERPSERPSVSEIVLPASFEAPCCSKSYRAYWWQPWRLRFRSAPRKDPRPAVARTCERGTQAPCIVVDGPAENGAQCLSRPVLVSMESNLSSIFAYSQASTAASGLSPALSVRKGDESPTHDRYIESRCIPLELLPDLDLPNISSSANSLPGHAPSSDPLLPKSILDTTGPWSSEPSPKDLKGYFDELDKLFPVDSPSSSGNGPTFVPGPTRRPERQTTWPQKQPTRHAYFSGIEN